MHVARRRGGCMTHDFTLIQGRRQNDQQFIADHADPTISFPTLHGAHLMRSRLKARWAERFEKKGFAQAPYGLATSIPCYFYEPRGMKRWPAYPKGHRYRVDFVLVYAVETILLEGEQRSRATRWEWISIKPSHDEADVEHLKQLVLFDSRHQRAFQCTGNPDGTH